MWWFSAWQLVLNVRYYGIVWYCAYRRWVLYQGAWSDHPWKFWRNTYCLWMAQWITSSMFYMHLVLCTTSHALDVLLLRHHALAFISAAASIWGYYYTRERSGDTAYYVPSLQKFNINTSQHRYPEINSRAPDTLLSCPVDQHSGQLVRYCVHLPISKKSPKYIYILRSIYNWYTVHIINKSTRQSPCEWSFLLISPYSSSRLPHFVPWLRKRTRSPQVLLECWPKRDACHMRHIRDTIWQVTGCCLSLISLLHPTYHIFALLSPAPSLV